MNSVASLEGEERREFLVFARKMLQWLPEDQKSARELCSDPWFRTCDDTSSTSEIGTNTVFCVMSKKLDKNPQLVIIGRTDTSSAFAR